jgi:type IV pilus assembly protein PilA
MLIGVQGSDFTAACIGNIDNDPTLDVWTISSAERTDASGGTVPPGTPLNEVNDVVE